MPAVLQIPELVLLPLPLWKLKKWIGRALALVLLLYFFILQTEGLDCLTYRAINGNNCHMCQPGYHKEGDCDKNGLPAQCVLCDIGTFQETCNQATKCAPCSEYCYMFNAEIVSKCNRTSDIICQCKEGYFLVNEGGDQHCYRQRYCPTGFGVRNRGTPISNTVCEPCIPGKTFSNVSSTIQQCRNCTVCTTIVISECTPVNDTVCATAAVDKALAYGSHDIAIAVCVTFAGLCLIGLLLFCIWRQRRIICSNYCGLPTISVPQRLYKVDEGKSVKIIVQVKKANTITWTLNRNLLSPGLNGYNYFSVDNPSLLLTHAVHSHGGEYILKASNNIRSVSSPPITLTVTAFRQSTDIQMDAGPIDQNDRDVHDDHMRLAASYQSPDNPSSSGNYHGSADGRDQTYLKELHQHNVCLEEPAGAPTPSDIRRIPTAFRQSPDIQMGVEPISKRDVDDVHIHLAAEHLGQDNHSSSRNYQDVTVKKEKRHS